MRRSVTVLTILSLVLATQVHALQCPHPFPSFTWLYCLVGDEKIENEKRWRTTHVRPSASVMIDFANRDVSHLFDRAIYSRTGLPTGSNAHDAPCSNKRGGSIDEWLNFAADVVGNVQGCRQPD